MRLLRHFLVSLCLSLSLSAIADESAPININTADVSELAGLNGVGQSKAEAIVAYRTHYGPFQSVDELVAVKGIGESLVNKNRAKIVLSSERTAQH